MDWIEEILVDCPQCGESFAIQIETAANGTVEMIEDCAVCCRPAAVSITVKDGEVTGITIEAS
jgi:transposase-like protein